MLNILINKYNKFILNKLSNVQTVDNKIKYINKKIKILDEQIENYIFNDYNIDISKIILKSKRLNKYRKLISSKSFNLFYSIFLELDYFFIKRFLYFYPDFLYSLNIEQSNQIISFLFYNEDYSETNNHIIQLKEDFLKLFLENSNFYGKLDFYNKEEEYRYFFSYCIDSLLNSNSLKLNLIGYLYSCDINNINRFNYISIINQKLSNHKVREITSKESHRIKKMIRLKYLFNDATEYETFIFLKESYINKKEYDIDYKEDFYEI